jgi:hypothetical protein
MRQAGWRPGESGALPMPGPATRVPRRRCQACRWRPRCRLPYKLAGLAVPLTKPGGAVLAIAEGRRRRGRLRERGPDRAAADRGVRGA